MKTNALYCIADSLPSSLNKPTLQEIAKVIDEALHKLDRNVFRILIYPELEGLPGDIVDFLAVQLHVDFYDYALPLAKRRTLVKNSIRWHMKKGTKAVVEDVIRAIFNSGIVEEWFEYGGRPYYFRCSLLNPDTPLTEDQIQQCLRAIDTVKNVRSWLDGLGFERTVDITSKVFSAMTSFKEYASGPVRPKDAILYKKLFVAAVINEYREVELT